MHKWRCNVLTTPDGREKDGVVSQLRSRMVCGAGAAKRAGLAAPRHRCNRRALKNLSCCHPAMCRVDAPAPPDGRIALLHAVAHIELNAVDLHWDIIARFAETPMPDGYFDDWVKAADEESKHFNLIADCLETAGSYYGAMPAHAGMWRAAEDTAGDFMGRLAVVPMVLEARGLDVTPGMISVFQKAGQGDVVDAMNVIYAEEVGHVAYGSKWFHFLCGRHDLDPKTTFHGLVRTLFSRQTAAALQRRKARRSRDSTGFLLAADRALHLIYQGQSPYLSAVFCQMRTIRRYSNHCIKCLPNAHPGYALP